MERKIILVSLLLFVLATTMVTVSSDEMCSFARRRIGMLCSRGQKRNKIAMDLRKLFKERSQERDAEEQATRDEARTYFKKLFEDGY